MAEKLNFALPENKPRASVTGAWTGFLLILLVALVGTNLYVTLSAQKPEPATVGGLSVEQAREMAAKLAGRGLYRQAAAAWQDYLAAARPTDVQRAQIHFQIGGLLEKAGLYGDAIEQYYRSEAAAAMTELSHQINAHIKECFERLGKFSALRYEMIDRTGMKPDPSAGAKVVAEIGAEKITEAQLDALIEESIDDQLAPMKAFLTAEQINEQRKRALEPFRSPQAKQEFLQSWLAQEILYRQALDQQLGEKPEVKRLVHSLTRQALSRQMLDEQLASKIHVTETDVQTYYAANKDKYVEPAGARISHILVKDREEADELLKLIREGADFGELAKGSSLDSATKQTGGKIAEEVRPGSYVPGVGEAGDLNTAIFETDVPKVLDRLFSTEKGWEIVRVDQKRPPRQKSFDEVRQQVTMEWVRRKSEEVQRDYLKEMMDKHKVIVHTSAFPAAKPEAPQEVSAKP